MSLPSKGPNSPFSVGGRTLLARTCTKCGELADGASFPIINRGTKKETRRRVCHNCQNKQKKDDREERGIGLPTVKPPEELQTHKYQLWTTEENKFLTDNLGTLTYEEIAIKLGRSLRAVYKRRDVLKLERVRVKHRVAKPWRIENQQG